MARGIKASNANIRIRKALLEADLAVWQLADLMQISETTLYRKFRHELPAEEQLQIINLIKEHAAR